MRTDVLNSGGLCRTEGYSNLLCDLQEIQNLKLFLGLWSKNELFAPAKQIGKARNCLPQSQLAPMKIF